MLTRRINHNNYGIWKFLSSNNIDTNHLNGQNIKKPNLFIVGAPKCGTTTLYHYLEKHPEVYFSEPKELNYFSNEEIQSQGLYYDEYIVNTEEEYLNIFRKAVNSHKIIGEASVSYLFYPLVAKKIKNFNPDSKIMIMLRDPVKRAWSHYLMDRRLGLVNKEFSDIYYSKSPNDSLYFQQYFLLGNYFTQIKRYFENFNEDQIFIIFSNELKEKTTEVLEKIFDFLGVDRAQIELDENFNVFREANSEVIKRLYTNASIRKLVSKFLPSKLKSVVNKSIFTEKKPQMVSSMERELREYYSDEVTKLEELLRVELKEWK